MISLLLLVSKLRTSIWREINVLSIGGIQSAVELTRQKLRALRKNCHEALDYRLAAFFSLENG